MGDKRIKAIVVRGTKDVNLARPAEYMELCNEVLKYIKVREEHPVPGVMTILQGLGSPQEMKHVDEEWHTRISCGGMPAPGKKIIGTRK